MTTHLFEGSTERSGGQALELLGNLLGPSTEYSVVTVDPSGEILLWNEGARRLYGYEPAEVIGKGTLGILHTTEDARSCRPEGLLESAGREGKWEGTVVQVRKDGQCFHARLVVLPRRDGSGQPACRLKPSSRK